MNACSASTGRGSHDPTAPPSSGARPPGLARDLAFPRAGRPSNPRLLHVYIATAPRPNAAPSVVFVDDAGRVLERIPLALIPSDAIARQPLGIAGRPPAQTAANQRAAATRSRLAFRGMVYALWNARRLGYRRVEVHSDEPAAVAQVNGDRRVEPEAVGAYLQARALMHLYKSARIDVGELVASAARPERDGLLEPWGEPALARSGPGPLAECAMSASS